jgi:hypothetical protein
VNPSDFFKSAFEEAWGGIREVSVFDTELLSEIARAPIDQADDVNVAQGLARLVNEELRIVAASDANPKLDDSEIALALKVLRAVLGRLPVAFDPPFRDFIGFRDYWRSAGLTGLGSWAKRREYLRQLFDPVFNRLDELELSADTDSGSIRGVDGQLKNIIFASTGPKPEIVLIDAVNNVIDIVKNGEHCLVYDLPLTNEGLTWGDLVAWRADRTSQSASDLATARDLYRRLALSVADNEVEHLIFRTYCERYGGEQGFSIPALLPQVYLHFDPFTRAQRRALGKPDYLSRERMDFLMLLPNGVRIVIEVDGKQHYADGDVTSPPRYADMVADDRALRLLGYEVFRFGGYSLLQPDAQTTVRKFFDDLFTVQLHRISGSDGTVLRLPTRAPVSQHVHFASCGPTRPPISSTPRVRP